MKLREIEFGHILGASGVQGFLGEGYQFHDFLEAFGLLDFAGVTFVAKTTTVTPNTGNMPLREDFRPRDWRPDCIWVSPLRKIALNAVGLSGPGTDVLLRDGRWQARTDPFMLSFMSLAGHRDERVYEAKLFARLLKDKLASFQGKLGLQINVSCPNTGHDTEVLVQDAKPMLDIFAELDIPLLVKVNPLASTKEILSIAEHPACDGFCLFNTLPFGKGNRVHWKGLFPGESPLKKFGGGGLSGLHLFPLVLEATRILRSAGMKKAIVAHSVMSREDVWLAKDAGASAIAIGTVVMTRPWRVRNIKRAANAAFSM